MRRVHSEICRFFGIEILRIYLIGRNLSLFENCKKILNHSTLLYRVHCSVQCTLYTQCTMNNLDEGVNTILPDSELRTLFLLRLLVMVSIGKWSECCSPPFCRNQARNGYLVSHGVQIYAILSKAIWYHMVSIYMLYLARISGITGVHIYALLSKDIWYHKVCKYITHIL